MIIVMLRFLLRTSLWVFIAVYWHRVVRFFMSFLRKGTDGSGKEGKPRYLMSDLMPYGTVGYQAFQVFLYYLYTGRLKASPTEETTCVDETCIHVACRPAINHALELMYASATFQMKELVLLFQVFWLSFLILLPLSYY